MTKSSLLQQALDANDIERLKELILTNKEFVSLETRQNVWLSLVPQSGLIFHKSTSHLMTNKHRDEFQVMKDVKRSFNNLQNKVDIKEIDALKIRLYRVIIAVLNSTCDLYYYQGYHDIASLVVLVFEDDNDAFHFLHSLTIRFLRDHMMPGIDSSMSQLALVPEIISKVDYKYFELIKNIDPLYALSCIISLFTHDIENINYLFLIWDSILVNDDPSLILYIYAAMMIYYKEEIYTDLNEMSDSSVEGFIRVENDPDIIQIVLCKFLNVHLNNNSLDSSLEVKQIIKLSKELQRKVELNHLPAFKKISKFSTLKCLSSSLTIFNLQVQEYEKAEKKNKIARSILRYHTTGNFSGYIKLSILMVAVLGVVMQAKHNLHFSDYLIHGKRIFEFFF